MIIIIKAEAINQEQLSLHAAKLYTLISFTCRPTLNV